MTTFDERERQFERQFANDAETRFKIEARRDKLVGKWAAERLGYEGQKADDYAGAVVKADLKEPGDSDVFDKLRADLPREISDQDIRAKMAECLEKAMKEQSKA